MKPKISNEIIIVLSFIIVAANGIIGHFFAPLGIDLTPLIIVITAELVLYASKNISLVWQSALVYLFIAINDILIKLYSGGSHDNIGLVWIHFYMLIGLIPAGIMLLIKILRSNEESVFTKVTALFLFPALLYIHFQLFSHLGLGRYYQL